MNEKFCRLKRPIFNWSEDDVRRRSGRFALVVVISCFLIVFSGCAFSGGTAENNSIYLPPLELIGDVDNCIKLQADAAGNITGLGSDEEDSLNFELKNFTADSGKYTGILISDILDASGVTATDSTMYLRGRDGMVACMAVSQIDKNYLVFGKNGWEAVSIDCPPSIDVKDLADIVIVADDPSQVAASVSVTDENGTERTISPGTLILKTRISELQYQGQSEKNGTKVSVLLTDNYIEIGDSKLTLDKNRIIVDSGTTEGAQNGADYEKN